MSVSSWLSLGRLYVSRNLSISSRLFNLLAYNYLQYSLMIFCISVVSVVISPLSFLILFIWVLSLFFLITLAKGLSIFFLSSQKTMSCFIDLFYFLISTLFPLWSLLFPSFCWLFLIILGCRLGCLFETFLISWGRPVLLWTFL